MTQIKNKKQEKGLHQQPLFLFHRDPSYKYSEKIIYLHMDTEFFFVKFTDLISDHLK